jgi:hypothetical protein
MIVWIDTFASGGAMSRVETSIPIRALDRSENPRAAHRYPSLSGPANGSSGVFCEMRKPEIPPTSVALLERVRAR